MKQSRLSHTISLCESIETLNEFGCLEVVRVLQQQSSIKNLHAIIIQVMMHATATMSITSLLALKDKVKSIRDNSTLQNYSTSCVYTRVCTHMCNLSLTFVNIDAIANLTCSGDSPMVDEYNDVIFILIRST